MPTPKFQRKRRRLEGAAAPDSTAPTCARCGAITAPAYMPAPPDGLCRPCHIRETGEIPAGYALLL